MEGQGKAEKLIDEASQLRTEMSAFQSIWQECADFALPLRRLGFNHQGTTPYRSASGLQSDVAVDALNTLASGMMSWVTPSQQNWFSWQPADGIEGGDALASWLADCTTRAHLALANSNFYHSLHLGYLDLGAFGTAGLYAEAGIDRPLSFRAWHCGSFACAENTEGTVDRVFRFFNYTAQQAVDRWGDDAPEKCRDDVKANRRHTAHPFIHAIYPRDRKDRAEGGPLGMPVASCYLSPTEKKLITEEGFDSMPVTVPRWLKWSEESPYGASPTMLAIADIKGSNYLEWAIARVAELKINPRIITQTDAVGTVDLGPGGITQVKSMQEKPEVWAGIDDYKVGIDLNERVNQRIQRAFHMPLFEQFARLEREITATEVRARQAEQLARISPAFTLLTTDLIEPLLERVFMLLFNGGHFSPPPREALAQDSAGQWRLLFPKTIQISRMSQAIEETKEHAFASTLATFIPLMEADPSLLDNFDLDVSMRDIGRGKGVPAKYFRDPELVAQIRDQRAQQAMAQQAAEFAAKQPELAMAAAGAAGV